MRCYESKIVDILGREIIDSRGNPTVEADVIARLRRPGPRRRAVGRLDRHARSGRAARRRQEALPRQGRAARPSPTSTARSARRCSARMPTDQAALDAAMIALDGTDNKARLGANALLAVSLANAHAAARTSEQSLYRLPRRRRSPKMMPVPMMNIINGGAHADNSVDIQEFMILPVGAPNFSRSAALRRGDLPYAQESPARAQARDRGRRRRRLRAGPAVERSGARDDPRRRSSTPATRPDATSTSASTSRARSSSRTASTTLESEGRKFTLGAVRRLPRGPRRPLPDHHHRRRHGRGRLGRLGAR